MTSKTFIILLVICAVLAGASWLLLQPGSSPGPGIHTKTGERLLAKLPVKEIVRIDIKGPEGGVVLEKGQTTWTVKNKFGFPADFPKLSEFVLKLRDMKISRSFPASEEILTRLSLHAPNAASKPQAPKGNNPAPAGKGTRVTLKDAGGKPLADILIGKARESDAGPGGNYVMPAGENTVYVVDAEFAPLDTTPGRWISKQLIDISSDRIARLDRFDRLDRTERSAADAPAGKKPAYTILNAGKDTPAALQDVPEGQKASPAKVNRVMDALAAFRIDDVVDPKTPADKTGLADAPCFRYTLVDGTVYTLCKGKTVVGNPDQTYLAASVAYHAPTAGEDQAVDSGKAAPPTPSGAEGGSSAAAGGTPSADTKSPADPAAAAAEQNRKLSPWIFVVPQWKADQLIVDKADFFETPVPAPGNAKAAD